MRLEITGQCVAQSQGRAEHDQDGVEALAKVLRQIADATTEPQHVKSGQAKGKGGHEVEPAVPAMKGWKAEADSWDELYRSTQEDEDGRAQMNSHDQIFHGM